MIALMIRGDTKASGAGHAARPFLPEGAISGEGLLALHKITRRRNSELVEPTRSVKVLYWIRHGKNAASHGVGPGSPQHGSGPPDVPF
jgi:hypothetical protein